jgi:hypothetical protein
MCRLIHLATLKELAGALRDTRGSHSREGA